VDWLGLSDFGVPKSHADIGDREARESHLTYEVQPVRPAISLLRAGQRLFQRLPELKCPTLIVHGAKDRLCPVSNAWRVAEHMQQTEPRVVILPRSHHIVTRDLDSELLKRELSAFSTGLTQQ
jgi:pimeloyl-ACP methyl ester carboxylesterase